MASTYTFGIEEEFFLVRPGNRNVAARVPQRLMRELAHGLGEQVAHEMLQSQLELVSPVLTHAHETLPTLHRLRRAADSTARKYGLRLVAAGTHPLAVWQDQNPSDGPRYGGLMHDYRIIGQRNVVCGMHVHVEIPPEADRIDVMNRMLRWLPLFLSLSASSPFWGRRRTGLMSYRQSLYDEWPRSGLPDWFENEQELAGLLSLLRRCGAVKDASYLWWVIRPSGKFPTLELRIADTRAEDAVAIAMLYRCLVAALIRRPELGRERTATTRTIVDENRWRAKRYGTRAQFIDDVTGAAEPLDTVLQRACELCADEIARFECAPHIAHLRTLLKHGNSAERQLAIYERHGKAGASRTTALQAVVDWLIAETVPDAAADDPA